MSSNLRFRKAKSQDDFILAFPLVQALNPHLRPKEYYKLCAEMQALGNYELVLAYREEMLVGICGYWIASKFYCGRYLEIDNFIINESYRGEEIGGQFINYIEAIAKENQCDCIMLDAYLENTRGHTFYKRNNYAAKGYHFIKKLS